MLKKKTSGDLVYLFMKKIIIFFLSISILYIRGFFFQKKKLQLQFIFKVYHFYLFEKRNISKL